MPRPAAELALPEPEPTRRQFDRAAPSFASASFLHDEARRRLLQRLEAFRLSGETFADIGSGPGAGAAELARQFPEASVIAVDVSERMLRHSVATGGGRAVVADATRLPFRDRSVDLLFANLLLPWTRPELLFAEARRTLSPTGLFVFSTLGPDSLMELRQAWLRADDAIHVHAFWDMQTLGDLAVRAGLEEPVLDVDRIHVTYDGLSSVIRDLRASGATNLAAGRRRGLTGRGCWQRFAEALWRDQGQGERQRLTMTVELISGQAFGSRAGSRAAQDGEVRIPLDSIGRDGKPSQ